MVVLHSNLRVNRQGILPFQWCYALTFASRVRLFRRAPSCPPPGIYLSPELIFSLTDFLYEALIVA